MLDKWIIFSIIRILRIHNNSQIPRTFTELSEFSRILRNQRILVNSVTARILENLRIRRNLTIIRNLRIIENSENPRNPKESDNSQEFSKIPRNLIILEKPGNYELSRGFLKFSEFARIIRIRILENSWNYKNPLES